MNHTKIWEQKVSIPTYGVGEQNKNPMFLEKRVYQGSSGRVYPHPVIDKILDEKKDVEHTVVFLENEYLQIQVMPDIGGRIYRALDKTNGYDFVYYNQVIKPALVGLTGPWISGGIEFNWPQHHRPNTYGPVEYRLDDTRPGCKTVWLSERDRMYGTTVTTGITLRDGVAAIEIHSELYNPTSEPQTFLWWANPAVPVHEETQSIFPPDVHAVMDHGKRDVSTFPIATGTYYKMDYSSGVDISRYHNIPVPTSYMAYHSDYDFVGGYDYREEAGVLHVADHHISPGKKQWTWGCGEFGEAWDRNLTDEDGPYIELMTGMFTDNQPDFTWLQPYENKSFTQYFLPYQKVGNVKIASKDVVAGLEVEEGNATVRIYVSRAMKGMRVRLLAGDAVYLDINRDFSPAEVLETTVPVLCPENKLSLTIEADGVEPLTFVPPSGELESVPSPAKAIPADPQALANNEALLLAGLHLEQYRHATYEPEPYYLEGLKRDPGDLRINNAYGNLLLRRGQFEEALAHFERAKETATRHSPNPYDGEVFYNLGKALELSGEEEKAYDSYYKATWSQAWKGQGYLKLAQIASRRKDYPAALAHAYEALYCGFKNEGARSALIILNRVLGNREEAARLAKETLGYQPMHFVALRESAVLSGSMEEKKEANAALRGDPHLVMALAREYTVLGFAEEGVEVLDDYLAGAEPAYAMVLYQKASLLRSEEAWRAAATANSSLCFPNTLEEYAILREAVRQNPDDAMAHYFIGCFLYDKKRPHDAAEMWEKAAVCQPDFPTVHRNLALYYANKKGNYDAARVKLEKAFALDSGDARVFYELCELYKKIGLPREELRERMEAHLALVEERDDLCIAYIEVLNGLGEYKLALDRLLGRTFHPWEGGEGKVPNQHVTARIGMARRLMEEGEFARAIEHLQKATVYEPSFGEGKLQGAQENHIYYYMGLAYRALDEEKAVACLEKACTGLSKPVGAMYYNDQPPHMIYFQGLALGELGREKEARSRFHKLISYGEKHVFEKQIMDYFAVSLPDFLVFETNLDEKNQIHCYYMMGLGYLGLGEKEKAERCFAEVLQRDPNYTFAV